MKLKTLRVSLTKYELEDLARIAATKKISAAGQAELFITSDLEYGGVVHRIEPSSVATLCGVDGKWMAVNTAAGVTCETCLKLQGPPGTEGRQ